jgi:excisionase family DNA binding protein
MPIRDLAVHTARYVTVAELAEYWAVSRQQIYKRIESGTLEAIRLGARLYRVKTSAALEYERNASIVGVTRQSTAPTAISRLDPESGRFPKKIGLQRVERKFATD